MKLAADEIVKIFRGLSIAASRARALAKDHGKEALQKSLSRHQQDAVRQHLIDIETDIGTLLDILVRKK